MMLHQMTCHLDQKFIQKPLCMHPINTKLCSLPLSKLHYLYLLEKTKWTIQTIMQLPSINLILIANSGISYQLRDAYFAWKRWWNAATYKQMISAFYYSWPTHINGMYLINDKKILSYRIFIYNWGGIFIFFKDFKNTLYARVLFVYTRSSHGTARFVDDRTCAKYRVIECYRVCRFIDVILEWFRTWKNIKEIIVIQRVLDDTIRYLFCVIMAIVW